MSRLGLFLDILLVKLLSDVGVVRVLKLLLADRLQYEKVRTIISCRT